MKKFWKALGLTALAAAVLPYRVRKDEEEETTTVDALMWQLIRRPGENGAKNQVDLNIGFKSPLQEVREERGLFTENPDEAVPFAGDAAADAPAQEAQPEEAGGDGAQQPAGPEAEATEEDFDPEL